MKCKDCPQRNQCDSAIKDIGSDINCLRYSRIQLPCVPGDDVYWIDDMAKGGPKVVRDPAAVEAVCYYGNGDFRVICRGDGTPERIGTKYCYLTREDAERGLAAMRQNEKLEMRNEK